MVSFGGMRIITSEYMTEAGDPIQVRRTWKERIDLRQPMFSWPWPPFVATRTVVPQVPRRDVLIVNGTLVMHPAMVGELREIAEAQP